MSDAIVIRVENLSLRAGGALYEPEAKQYRIDTREGYKTFRETLVDAAKAPFHRLRGAVRKLLRAKRSKPDPMRHAPSPMPAEGIVMRHALCPLRFTPSALCSCRESNQ
jgi:hypothetical protein